jgi:hypothetical protein
MLLYIEAMSEKEIAEIIIEFLKEKKIDFDINAPLVSLVRKAIKEADITDIQEDILNKYLNRISTILYTNKKISCNGRKYYMTLKGYNEFKINDERAKEMTEEEKIENEEKFIQQNAFVQRNKNYLTGKEENSITDEGISGYKRIISEKQEKIISLEKEIRVKNKINKKYYDRMLKEVKIVIEVKKENEKLKKEIKLLNRNKG